MGAHSKLQRRQKRTRHREKLPCADHITRDEMNAQTVSESATDFIVAFSEPVNIFVRVNRSTKHARKRCSSQCAVTVNRSNNYDDVSHMRDEMDKAAGNQNASLKGLRSCADARLSGMNAVKATKNTCAAEVPLKNEGNNILRMHKQQSKIRNNLKKV
jgi:hypothetical protein